LTIKIRTRTYADRLKTMAYGSSTFVPKP
jgi:hypothetical protein